MPAIQGLASARPILSPVARSFILYGLLYDAVFNLIRPFGATFLTRVGGGAAEIFFYNSTPALFSAIILLPSILIVRALGDAGKGGLVFLGLSRFFIALTALVPFLPPQARAWGFIILSSLTGMADAAGQSALQAYIGQAIAGSERAKALSRRLAAGQTTVVITLVVSALVLRVLPSLGIELILLYQCLFLCAFVLSLVELRSYRALIRSGGVHGLTTGLRLSLKRMLGDKRFLSFAGCSLLFHFGWQLGWPIFSVWQVSYLKADELWLGIFTLVGSLVMFGAYPVWRRIIDKRGLGFALGMATLGQALNPVLIALSNTLPLQALCQVSTAFFTAGVSVSLLAGLLASSPDGGDRISYAAAYNTALYVCQVVSQQIGLLIYRATSIRAAMFIDSGLRVFGAAAFILLWLKGRRAPRVPDPVPGASSG